MDSSTQTEEIKKLDDVEMAALMNRFRAEFIERAPPAPTSPRGEKTTELWRSKCCSEDGTVIDKKFLSFATTSLLSIIVLVFALVQLTLSPDSELTSLWVSLVSTITSLHVPSPLSQFMDNKDGKK